MNYPEKTNPAMTPEQEEMAIYEKAVDKYGTANQIVVAIEEMSELTKALAKYLRYGATEAILASIQEERADVEIMLNQLHVIFGDCADRECDKLAHLKELLEQ